ncbi:hypothetical protein [Pedosphaera parvula]|uniref:Uncharacterized protein n=1 Tax=Pedosphaera parvula (strain Ellin514) TaxID=320771 RepID=B9XBW5_PEDPL|nr:hypothetical protein [Pedosphaera parvula]EEF62433.1 hypothetical protein Cflav_PD5068 [Pedosphaera parvula Ellin514]
MADQNPSLPGGAVPPQPPEGAKVQPKKETVRINLPPKPSAAPTIKLPTLPPGGPSAVPGAPAFTTAPTAAPAAPAAAPRIAAAPVAAAPAQRPVQRAPVAPPKPALSTIDVVLAIAAAVAGLVAVGSTVYCMSLFT